MVGVGVDLLGHGLRVEARLDAALMLLDSWVIPGSPSAPEGRLLGSRRFIAA